MRIGVYPGTFDPITNGHLDIIKRSAKMFDKLVVGVLANNSKTPLFSAEERVNMLQEATSHLDNVEVMSFKGLLVDFVQETNASVVVRGLRAITDFEYELQMAQTNHVLKDDMDTIFLTTSLKYSYLSSSTVKEVARWGGDISEFVPPNVVEKVRDKYNDKI